MFDILKQSVFASLGLVKAGLKKSVEEARNELQAVIDQRIQAAIDQLGLGLARADDLQAMVKRVGRLEC